MVRIKAIHRTVSLLQDLLQALPELEPYKEKLSACEDDELQLVEKAFHYWSSEKKILDGQSDYAVFIDANGNVSGVAFAEEWFNW